MLTQNQDRVRAMRENTEARKRHVLGNNSPEARKRSRPPPASPGGNGPTHGSSTDDDRPRPASPGGSDLPDGGSTDDDRPGPEAHSGSRPPPGRPGGSDLPGGSSSDADDVSPPGRPPGGSALDDAGDQSPPASPGGSDLPDGGCRDAGSDLDDGGRSDADDLSPPASPRDSDLGDGKRSDADDLSPPASPRGSDLDDGGHSDADDLSPPASPRDSDLDDGKRSDADDLSPPASPGGSDLDDGGRSDADDLSPPASPRDSDLDDGSGSDADDPSPPASPRGSNAGSDDEREMMEMLLEDSDDEQPGGTADGAEGSTGNGDSDDTGFLVFVSGRHKLQLTPARVAKLLKGGVCEVVSKHKHDESKSKLAAANRRIASLVARRKSLKAELSKYKKQEDSKEAKTQKAKRKKEVLRVQNYRHRKRIQNLLNKNKAFKAEINDLRKTQTSGGIALMRKGKKPRSHLTLACIAMTIDGIEQGNVAACRWQPLCKAIQKHVAKPGETVDLQSPSDRQVRRLLEMDDYIQLAHEKEELAKQAPIQNLQFMCDISPMLKRKHADPKSQCKHKLSLP